VLDHDWRKIIHFAATENPTQVWLSLQMTEAFPWDPAPRYLLRDRDASYGPAFRTSFAARFVEKLSIYHEARTHLSLTGQDFSGKINTTKTYPPPSVRNLHLAKANRVALQHVELSSKDDDFILRCGP
jgi:hypothetical protein